METKNLLKTFTGFAVGPIGAAGINFLTIPITTWFLSPHEFGKTSFFLLLQTLAAAVIFFGMDQSYAREFNNYQNKRKLLFNCLVIPIILSIAFLILLIIFAHPVINLITKEQSSMVLVLFAIYLPFLAIERFLLLSIRMEEKGFSFSIFSILSKLFALIFIIVLLMVWEKSYLAIITATVMGQILVDIILIIYCRKSIEIKWSNLDKELLLKLIRFGAPFIPSSLILWCLGSTDRLMLEKFSSYNELGFYLAALKVVGVFTIFQNIFSTFWIPIAYKWEQATVDTKVFNKISHYLSFIMSFVFVFILLFKELFVLLLSERYHDSVYLIPFLLFTPIMLTLGETTGLGIAFSRKTYLNIWISMAVASVNFALNFILIHYMSAVGASIATGGSYILYFWIRTIVSRSLWFKFDLKYFLIITVILITAAGLNITVRNNSILFINVSLLIIIVYVNRQTVREILLKLQEITNRLLFQKRSTSKESG